MSESTPAVGKAAPAFTLPAVFPGEDPNAEGAPRTVRLSQFRGERAVVLYFYPRDATPGCTTEACDFREATDRLTAAGVQVLGVSTDDAASHARFIAEQGLTFPLLCDVDHAVCEQYGVWVEKNLYGRTSMGVRRATFLIGADGRVKAAWPKVKVKGHVDEVLAAVDGPGDDGR